MCDKEVIVGINDRSSGPEKMKPVYEKHQKKLKQLLEDHHQDVDRNG